MQILDLSEPEIYKSPINLGTEEGVSYTDINFNIYSLNLNKYITSDLVEFELPNTSCICYCMLTNNNVALVMLIDIYDNYFVIPYAKLLKLIEDELGKYYNKVIKDKIVLSDIKRVNRALEMLSYLEPNNIKCVDVIEFNKIYQAQYNKKYSLTLNNKILAKSQDIEIELQSSDISINFNYIKRNKIVKHYLTVSNYIKLSDIETIKDFNDDTNTRLCPYCMTKEDSNIHKNICNLLREVN